MVIGMDRYRTGIAISLLLSAVCLPIFPSLWLLRGDPASGGGSPELEQALEWTKAEAREGDLIIVDCYGTHLWQLMMNNWDMPIPWYSLPYEIPGADRIGSEGGENPPYATLKLFDKLDGKFSRLIYLTSQETPDFLLGREEGWLQAHHFLKKEAEFSGYIYVKVSIFSP